MPDTCQSLPLIDVLREHALAARWGKSIRFLQRQRQSRHGPPWFKIGSTVFYRVDDVLAFETSLRRGGEGSK